MRGSLLPVMLAGCGGAGERTARALTGGDPARGQTALYACGCGGCHQIPGVRGAAAAVAAPLDRIARRQILAGFLPNTPDNLIQWVRHPQAAVPGNAMPDVGVAESDARDMAAYLYTLR